MRYMKILTFFINPAPPYFKVFNRFDPTLKQKDADANHLNPYNPLPKLLCKYFDEDFRQKMQYY